MARKQPERQSKKWYESATLWTNVGALAGSIGAFFSGELSKEALISTSVLAIVNTLLRMKTETGVGK